ncbi:MAG: 3-hydroxyisobutyrate dehydrogenase [Gammaproteobacteria bacterium]
MNKIGFIGVGHMGGPMAANLVKAGFVVTIYDIVPALTDTLKQQGAQVANSIADVVKNADVIISMLPEGKHVLAAYLGDSGILAHASPSTLLIDSSTIDINSARQLHQAAMAKGLALIDAPVSGGTTGAAAATLTFMVGGDKKNYELALPILSKMGKKIFYAGVAGSGQAAKICNNMLLGISMIGVSEAFHLADKLGLDAQTFYDIASVSSGQCWSMTSYCPVPGPVPAAPSNHDYEPGFAAKMMLKDLKLAQQAAIASGANTLLGAEASAIYNLFCTSGFDNKDFSAIYPWLSHKL